MDYSGQQFEQYRLIEKLGQGGMATVYKAYDTRLERDVAIKVVRKESIPPEQLERILKRFEREAKALAKFLHPNIVPVHDYGEWQGAPYLVMAYLPGGTLKDRIGAPVAVETALGWVTPIANALSFAHKRGVIHRDVKPSNILTTEDGSLMLSDFGIAQILEESTTQLTATGMGVGTPEYMAPEQWQGKATEASDQYALGVVLYELLTGVKPFSAETPLAVALKVMSEPLPRPSTYVPDIPEEVEKVLYKALAREPHARYESMRVFCLALGQLENTIVNPGGAAKPAGLESSKDLDDVNRQIGEDGLDETVDLISRDVPLSNYETKTDAAFDQPIPSQEAVSPQVKPAADGMPVTDGQTLSKEQGEKVKPIQNSANPNVGERTGLKSVPYGSPKAPARESDTRGLAPEKPAGRQLQGPARTKKRKGMAWLPLLGIVGVAVVGILLVVVLVFVLVRQSQPSSVAFEQRQMTAAVQSTEREIIRKTTGAEAQMTSTARINQAGTAMAQSTVTAALEQTATAVAQSTATARAQSTATAQAHITATAQAAWGVYNSYVNDTNLVLEEEFYSLDHKDDDLIKTYWTGLELKNFAFKVSFENPYDSSIGSWDYGLLFRHFTSNDQYRLYIRSEGSWVLRNNTGTTDGTIIDEGTVSLHSDTNHLMLIAIEDEGYLFINNQFMASLDLSARTEPGSIMVGTGFINGREVEGYATNFNNLKIYSLDTISTVGEPTSTVLAFNTSSIGVNSQAFSTLYNYSSSARYSFQVVFENTDGWANNDYALIIERQNRSSSWECNFSSNDEDDCKIITYNEVDYLVCNRNIYVNWHTYSRESPPYSCYYDIYLQAGGQTIYSYEYSYIFDK